MTDYVSGYMMSGNLNVGNVNAASTVVMGSSFLRNRIINGAMQIWQRATSSTNSGTGGNASAYSSVDRWQIYRNLGVTGLNSSQQTSGPPTGFQYYTRVQRAAGDTSTNTNNFAQAIETVNSIDLAGKTLALSFWARAGSNYSSASSILSASIAWGTGTDQSIYNGFTGYTPIGTNVTLTTSWQFFTVTATIGAAATQVGVTFQNTPTGTAGANDYFDITGVQLEQGSFATPFERRQFTQELQLCQRYYEKTYNLADAPGTATYSGSQTVSVNTGSRQIGGYFNVRKRNASSTVTIYAAATGASGNITASAANRAASSVDIGESGFRLQVTGGVAISEDTAMHWVAANEL